MKRIIFPMLIYIFIGIMGFAGYKLWSLYAEYKTGEDAYAGLEQYVAIPTPQLETSTPTPVEPEEAEPGRWDDIQWPEVDFKEFAAENSDIVGWSYCEDTVSNHPVVQGDDNAFYHHTQGAVVAAVRCNGH